jgi:hypothetical protein
MLIKAIFQSTSKSFQLGLQWSFCVFWPAGSYIWLPGDQKECGRGKGVLTGSPLSFPLVAWESHMIPSRTATHFFIAIRIRVKILRDNLLKEHLALKNILISFPVIYFLILQQFYLAVCNCYVSSLFNFFFARTAFSQNAKFYIRKSVNFANKRNSFGEILRTRPRWRGKRCSKGPLIQSMYVHTVLYINFDERKNRIVVKSFWCLLITLFVRSFFRLKNRFGFINTKC